MVVYGPDLLDPIQSSVPSSGAGRVSARHPQTPVLLLLGWGCGRRPEFTVLTSGKPLPRVHVPGPTDSTIGVDTRYPAGAAPAAERPKRTIYRDGGTVSDPDYQTSS